jgi:integrase
MTTEPLTNPTNNAAVSDGQRRQNDNHKPKRKKNRERRGRGEGGIRWREDKGLWEATISLGYDGDGKRIRRTIYGATKAAALDEVARLRGKPVEPAQARSLTVTQLVARWLESTKDRTSARTHEDRVRIAAAHLTPRLGCVVVSKLTPLAVESYYAAMRRDEVGPGAARHAAKALVAALNYSVRLGIIPASPALKVPLPPEPQREMVVLTPKLVRHFLARTAHLPVHPMLVVALGTGMRQGELLGLHWPDVDLAAKTITVRQALTWTRAAGPALKVPKTRNARRTITLPCQVVESLRQLRQLREAAGLLRCPVFCTKRDGKFLSWRNVLHRFDAAVEWADDPNKGRWPAKKDAPKAEPVMPPGFRFHDMRHSHASILLSQGASLKAVSQRLGHANAALTLRIYAHVMPGDDAKLADVMAGVMG